MRQTILILSFLLLAMVPATAQYYPDGRPIPPRHRYGNTYRQSSPCASSYYGLRLGLGLATVSSDSKYLDANKVRTGLSVGAVAGWQLSYRAPVYFETGLYYNEKGGKSTYDGDKFTYSLNYLEVPLVVKYRYAASPGITVEPFAGGFLSCGVGGKIKDFGQREAYSSFGDDYTDNFRRFDGGLRLGCGLGLQNFYVEAAYDVGLANVGKDDFDDTHTGNFNLTLGVNF